MKKRVLWLSFLCLFVAAQAHGGFRTDVLEVTTGTATVNLTATGLSDVYSLQARAARYVSYNTDHTLTLDEAGKDILVNNGANDVTISTPVGVTEDDIGTTYRVVKLGSGDVSLQASGSQTLENSNAGGYVKNEETNRGAASLLIRLVTATRWAFLHGFGVWSTSATAGGGGTASARYWPHGYWVTEYWPDDRYWVKAASTGYGTTEVFYFGIQN